ncbi:MAG TPA: hypothetical protein VHW44_23850 [Pseudonocardiaceae bacterium]|jgi:hypothetical protein|nr:hypothetical protein [Pseudonocardiaceae bacterium]
MIVRRRSPVEPDVLHALKAVGGLWPAEVRGLPYARVMLDVLGLIGGIVGTVALAAAVPSTAGDRTSLVIVLVFTALVSVLGVVDLVALLRPRRPQPAPAQRLYVVR